MLARPLAAVAELPTLSLAAIRGLTVGDPADGPGRDAAQTNFRRVLAVTAEIGAASSGIARSLTQAQRSVRQLHQIIAAERVVPAGAADALPV
jgi:hypothetical protein